MINEHGFISVRLKAASFNKFYPNPS